MLGVLRREKRRQSQWSDDLGFYWKEGAWQLVSLSLPCHSAFPAQLKACFVAPQVEQLRLCSQTRVCRPAHLGGTSLSPSCSYRIALREMLYIFSKGACAYICLRWILKFRRWWVVYQINTSVCIHLSSPPWLMPPRLLWAPEAGRAVG